MTDTTSIHGQDIYGDAYVPREAMLKAMDSIGLQAEDASGRVSSAVRFTGEIDGISVTVNTHIMRKMTRMDWHLCDIGAFPRKVKRVAGGQWAYIQSYHPSSDSFTTHFKVKGYIAESVTLRGKGRDKQAWVIYRLIASVINKATGFTPADDETIETRLQVIE